MLTHVCLMFTNSWCTGHFHVECIIKRAVYFQLPLPQRLSHKLVENWLPAAIHFQKCVISNLLSKSIWFMSLSVKLIVSTASHEQDDQKRITSLLSHHRILVGDIRRTTRSLQYPFDKQDVVKWLFQIVWTFVFWFTRELLLL